MNGLWWEHSSTVLAKSSYMEDERKEICDQQVVRGIRGCSLRTVTLHITPGDAQLAGNFA